MGTFSKKSDNSGYTGREVRSVIGDVLPAYLTGDQPPMAGQGVNLSKAAKLSVEKRPTFAGRQFALYKATDVSGSMECFLRDGSVDYLDEAINTVAFENNWDADNVLPVFPYATATVGQPMMLKLGEHRGSGARTEQYARQFGVGYGTYFVPPITRIVQHYKDSDDWGRRPAIVFFQTDGMNGDMRETAAALERYSELPIFWVFVFYGDVSADGSDQAANLRKLDDGQLMPGRKTDNVSVFLAGPDPKLVTPLELYDGLLTGPAAWLRDAPRDGVHVPA